MATHPLQTPQDHVVVTEGRAAKTIQVIQGAYYVVGGLLVALFLDALRGPLDPEFAGSNLWLARIIALIVVGFGVALFISGRGTRRPFISAGLAMWVALALFAQTVIGMVFGVLPPTFLLDAALELGFAVWWIALMFSRGSRRLAQSAAQSP